MLSVRLLGWGSIGGNKGGWNDASDGTLNSQGFPKVKRDELTKERGAGTVCGVSGVNEVKGSLEV